MSQALHNEFAPDSIEARDLAHLLHPNTNLGQLHGDGPAVHARAEGVYLWDNQGKQYIEGMAGLWCTALGYGEEELARVAAEQMRKLSYSQLFAGKTNRAERPARREDQVDDAVRGRARLLRPVRFRRQRHPGQADVVLPQPHRQAGTQEDHFPAAAVTTALPSPRGA